MEDSRSKSIVQEKSFRFAVHLVHLLAGLWKDLADLILARQLLRSGASIGANIEEVLGRHDSMDFVAKLSIAAKEARETGHWLRLLQETQPDHQQDLNALITDCDSLLRMLNSIILTTRSELAAPDAHCQLRINNSEPRTT